MAHSLATKDYPGLVYLSRQFSGDEPYTPVLLTTEDFDVVLTLNWTPMLRSLAVDQVLFVRAAKSRKNSKERSLTLVKLVPVLENGDTTTAERIVKHWIQTNVAEFKSFIEANAVC